MRINRGLILIMSLTLQIASWFDIRGALAWLLPPSNMTPLQTAQLVASGVLFIVWFAVKPERKGGDEI